MPSRTYLPTLCRFLQEVCKYIARYRDVLVTFLTPEQVTLLDAVVAACHAFTANVECESILT